jgi:hypothetical protein
VGQRQPIRLLRADTASLTTGAEPLGTAPSAYIVVARLTLWVKRAAQRVETVDQLGRVLLGGRVSSEAIGLGGSRAALRGGPRASARGPGQRSRKLIEVPGYTFRVFVTSSAEAPAAVWRITTAGPT